jgi:hypothetical protein
MIHILADESARIGRPPVVRDRVLACLRSLGRARVARIAEETGCGERSIHDILVKAHARGEVSVAKHGRYFVYEVANG